MAKAFQVDSPRTLLVCDTAGKGVGVEVMGCATAGPALCCAQETTHSFGALCRSRVPPLKESERLYVRWSRSATPDDKEWQALLIDRLYIGATCHSDKNDCMYRPKQEYNMRTIMRNLIKKLPASSPYTSERTSFLSAVTRTSCHGSWESSAFPCMGALHPSPQATPLKRKIPV